MKKITYFIILFVSIFVLSNSVNAWSKYEVGDKVTYKEIDFYVIKDSDENNDIVILLKAEPLSVDEVNRFGEGHVNRYMSYSVGTASNESSYGGMAYYTSEICSNQISGCTNDYEHSEVKYVVDAWKNEQAPLAIEARLILFDELTQYLGYEQGMIDPSTQGYVPTSSTPSWVYNVNYWYWTMSKYQDSSSNVWIVKKYLEDSGVLGRGGSYGVVRPVITISKSVIEDSNDQEEIDDDKNNAHDNNFSEDMSVITKTEDSKVSVNVPNTMQKISVVLIMAGIVLVSISIVIIVKNKDKLQNK